MQLIPHFLSIISVVQTILPGEWPASYNIRDGDRFDFIVVGAGSAGAIVAARLSEDPNYKVLLIEPGGNPPLKSQVPSLFATLHHTEYDWDYHAQLDNGTGQAHPNGVIYMSRGKVLGGCSSTNYMIYSRGVQRDYDDWDKIAPGWAWNTSLYYFKKLEGMTDPSVMNNPSNSYLHSTEGPVLISRPETNSYFTTLSNNYLDSLEELGIKRLLEINGPESFGASLPHCTFANGRRSSTAEAYLKPAKNRPNLYVAKYSRVTQVLIDKNKMQAFGVEVLLISGQLVKTYANKEVIISAGTIDSPKILMLSGIGPEKDLNKIDVDLIADLPVGKNLHDHQAVNLIFSGQRGLQTQLQNLFTLTELDSYPVPIQVGFFNTNNKPQFQIFNIHVSAGSTLFVEYLCKSIVNYDDAYCSSMINANTFRDIDVTQLVFLHPLSRGQVTLRSKNPYDDPIIQMGYFRNEKDLDMMTEGFKFMTRLVNTTYFKSVNAEVASLNFRVKGCEGVSRDSEEFLRCFVKNTVTSLLHPVGTCAMGPDGVVDETLRVHGITGLRVVDASIMPISPSGNTNTPAMMIGERGADLIKLYYDITT